MLLSFEPHSHKELKEITGWEGIRLTKVLQYMEFQGHIERANRKWNLTLKGLETLKRGNGSKDTSKKVENLEEARQYLGGIKSLLTSSESAAL
jgi:hypothetical protein